KHFDNVLDDKNWQVTRSAELARHGKSEIEQLIGYYNEVVADTHPHNAVYGAISLVTHDVSHYQKMVVGLLPLFSILNASPLDELISPRNNDEDEIIGGGCETGHIGAELKTPIIDTKKIIEEGGVLYMSLDSLSDSKTAGHLAKLILSDMAAVAGDRYNHEGNKRRVSIFVDEVHAAVAGNDALINLLAQGRAAQMQCFLATQTIPDLEDKTSPAAAERFVGLCNNFISMRVNDERTQEYVTRNFGKSGIIQQKVMMSQNASTDSSIDDFSGSYAETLSKIESDSFPAQLLTDMPKLQFIGRLADGRKIKGRLKIITE
ncbi:MAG: conjugal transfer pilus assembly protein TraD, partial [Paraglaciecola sp.]